MPKNRYNRFLGVVDKLIEYFSGIKFVVKEKLKHVRSFEDAISLVSTEMTTVLWPSEPRGVIAGLNHKL